MYISPGGVGVCPGRTQPQAPVGFPRAAAQALASLARCRAATDRCWNSVLSPYADIEEGEHHRRVLGTVRRRMNRVLVPLRQGFHLYRSSCPWTSWSLWTVPRAAPSGDRRNRDRPGGRVIGGRAATLTYPAERSSIQLVTPRLIWCDLEVTDLGCSWGDFLLRAVSPAPRQMGRS
jgi:hypothetical protein